jgi:cell division protein FtsI/penicillin-binding protein 2
MARALPYRRLALLTGLLLLAFAGLAGRLFHLQVLRHEELRQKARENTERTFQRKPRRGDIRDSRGNLLATSVPVKTVCADPTLILDRQAQVAQVLAPLLKTNASFLIERLQLRVLRHDRDGQPVFDKHVVLKHKVSLQDWERIRVAMTNANFAAGGRPVSRRERFFLHNLRHKAVFTEDDQLRVYPNQTLAAHVLGFAGPSEDGSGLEGKDGIELILNSKLAGVRGWLQTERDKGGAELVALRQQDVKPRDGLNVVLTIDAGLQYIVETELAEGFREQEPLSISAIVVRPRTGEIVAMANLPTFDPNQPGEAPEAARRNRVITDLAEPGSTFKVVVASAALNEGVVSLADRFDCEQGRFLFAGRILHDVHPYGVLSVEQIIAKSSNIGAAKVALRLGQEKLHEYIRNFGFGRRTGIPLLGEISGIVHPLKDWTKLSISRIPMGHEIAVTPLQMVMAMSALANQGRLMRPMLVQRLEDDQGHIVAQYEPQFVRQVVSPAGARQIVSALKQVVSTNGTAIKARLDRYVVAGKTGTAEKVGPGGYLRNKNFASFIGFFPADDPELCISVVLDEPKKSHLGGQAAAPVFQRIAERAANYLGLRPNLPSEPEASAVAQSKTRAAGLVAARPTRPNL